MKVRAVFCTLIVAGFTACDGGGVRVLPAGKLTAAMDTSAGERSATIAVRGFSSDELQALRKLKSDAEFQEVAAVSVDGNATPIVGRYSVSDTSLQFTPQFPFDAGRPYNVLIKPGTLSSERGDTANYLLRAELPAAARKLATSVIRILPSGDVLPENLLRLYIEFSQPMSHSGGLGYIKLLDESGQEVKQAFLPIEADFWSGDHKRYTAFLDPGRVKRGILPNEQLGRALIPGRRYTIAVDSAWQDANGQNLSNEFRRVFTATKPDEQRIDYKRWTLSSPRAGSRDTLVVKLDKQLDHGLLKRALGVETTDGKGVAGETDVMNGEREWRFVPNEPWRAGKHNLLILAFLEDPAGNRIDGAFEVDMFDKVDSSAKAERYLLTFTVFSH